MKKEVSQSNQVRNSFSRALRRRGFILIALVLCCFALSLTARAADGGLGNQNTAEGNGALFNLTTGVDNTAIGFRSLYSLTTGGSNTATGSQALYSNTTGSANTATGFDALQSNTTGYANTATGTNALIFNTTGFENTATGINALQSNTSGHDNTAVGSLALVTNTTGDENTATGFFALASNNGYFNTATGYGALSTNIPGSNNIAIGYFAGTNVGAAENDIYIGNPGPGFFSTESNAIRIGTQTAVTDINGGTHAAHKATFIAGISGVAVTGSTVVVGPHGKLGVAASSARFKEAIKPMDKASETILALRPVTFRYKKEIDPDSTPQFGLVAEEVAKVNPALVNRDADGKVFTVRYDAVNAMLLNEFLKERGKVQKMEATVEKQQRDFQAVAAQQQKQIEALTTGLQKVTARLAASKPAQQVVNNNQ